MDKRNMISGMTTTVREEETAKSPAACAGF